MYPDKVKSRRNVNGYLVLLRSLCYISCVTTVASLPVTSLISPLISPLFPPVPPSIPLFVLATAEIFMSHPYESNFCLAFIWSAKHITTYARFFFFFFSRDAVTLTGQVFNQSPCCAAIPSHPLLSPSPPPPTNRRFQAGHPQAALEHLANTRTRRARRSKL